MKKTSFIFILIFSVFFSYKIAFAVNYIQLYPQISTSGVVSDTAGCPWGSGSIYGYKAFSGTPHTGTQTATANSDTICGYYTGGYGATMEATWGNGAIATPDGNYYQYITHSGSAYTPNWTNDVYFWIAHRVGGVWSGDSPIPPPDTQGTYNESPYNGEVVSTSGTGDVLVAFDYYLDTEQDPDHDTAEWCMRLVRNDGAGNAEFCDDVAFDTYTEVSHTFTGLALDSQWDWSIIFTRPGFFIDEYSILHAGSNYFFAGRFTIDSTVEEIYTAYTTCSITDLAGCFQNAIVFLFYPSQSSLNDFSNLYDAIKNKPPFGYISAVQTALQGINDTETSAFTLETMPILDTYIFTPVRTALIWIMWLAFIFMFYHRLKNIHL